MIAIALPLSGLLGCADPEDALEPTVDTRVDHAGADDPFDAEAPRACYTADGRVYAVWQEDREGRPGIWFNASNDGGSAWFPSDIAVDHSEADALAPAIGCDGERVWVAWEDERDGELQNRNIYLNRSEDGGQTWLEEDLLLDGDVEGTAMSLGPQVVAAGDRVVVAWFDGRNGAYDIFVQASADGGRTWLESPTRVDDDGPGEAYSASPRLVATAGGAVVVTWEDSRDGGTDIYAAASDDGGQSFTGETRLDAGEPGDADSLRPRIALDGEHVYVVWHDERAGDAEGRDVYLAHSADLGGAWSEALRADTDAEGLFDSINPDVSAAGGRAQVVWQDNRAGGYDILHRIYDADDADWAYGDLRLDTDTAGTAQSYFPRVVALGDDVLVAWQDYRADGEGVGFNDLFYNYSRDRGNRWTANDWRINSNAPGSSYAVDVQPWILGDAYAALWVDGRLGSGDVYFASRALGTNSVYVAPEEEEGVE